MFSNQCFHFLDILRSGVAGSCDSFVFSFLRKLHTIFYSGYAVLHFQQQCISISICSLSSSTFVISRLFVNSHANRASHVALMVKSPHASPGDIRNSVRSLCWENAWRRAWQPTPVFLPGESHNRGAWQATVHGITLSQTQLKQLSMQCKRYEVDISLQM